MFQHGLVCTDFNDGLQRLIRFIPDLAKGGFKRIVFLHTVSVWEDERVASVDEKRITAAQQYFDSITEGFPEGVEVKVEITTSRYLDKILELIKTYDIDVIFMGTPVRSSLEATFLGSHTLELAKATAIPLMILRPQLISTYTQEELSLRCQHLWRYLLVPYEDSPAGNYLITKLKEYAQNRPEGSWQECLLLWVVDDGGRQVEVTQYRLEAARQKLEAVKQDLESLNLTVHITVRQGNPVHEMLRVAQEYDVAAIAIANYRGNFLDWMIESTAETLLTKCWFPILFCSPES
ncbi:MAG: universal stress protein [Snowella sp.]|nr:universal stress protein [Snowella sp.]